ncbi:MAG: kinase [Sphingomonas sp. 67-36]|uniref:ATP-binding protein n=1 Tax=uncultured Sphingomonas sp. TaxID=158754 RepID=UPI000926C726|nr:ATP-binding protein [uncultured Sphingomonas sp.]MBN8848125.1 response regulator [Sphingomonas sp.]OJV31861.1 MAG: kinase [Sphingomonas sp. 67-36]
MSVVSAIDGGNTRERAISKLRTIALALMGVLGVAVLFALIVTLGEANRQRDRAIQLQSHSYDIMVLARTLDGTIAESEASLGRFVISGDKQLGQLYYDKWQLAGKQIDRLADLASQNDSQIPRLAQLRLAYQQRGKELSLIALSTNYGKNDQALSLYYRAREAPSLTAIDRILEEVIRSERNLLDQRTRETRAAIERATRLARIFSAFGILILVGAIALGALTVRALTERGVARAEAAAERERADQFAAAVAVATAELRQQETRLRQVQKMEAVGQLTGGIAHDFNNMLAVVMGGLELAQRGLAGTTARKEIGRHVDSAMEGAKRAAALTGRLLSFTREAAINPEAMRAADLLRGMSDLLDRTLGDAITVVIRDESAGWRLRADRVQIENSILNLAVNARDAMDGRGTLTVTAGTATLAENERECAAGDYLTIAVTDTGCGMAPEVAERVFEPFFTTKPVGKGTGLGLSQIFAFVRQQSGAIAVDTAPGAGTTITLYLPREHEEAPAPPATSDEEAFHASPAALDVLVVEDDPRVLAATSGALRELGHRPIPCNDPLAAPAMLAAHDAIRLILSDVLMPTQTGPEMIAALDRRYAHIPVLFVTGFAGEASEGDAFAGHHVLRKPFTLNALDRAIAAATGADRAAARPGIAAE